MIGNKAMMQTLRPHIVPYNISSVDQKIGAVVLRHASRYQPLIQSICEERDKLYQALANLQTITIGSKEENACIKDLLVAFDKEDTYEIG